MNAPGLDRMMEATRLTREGRLDEAMAVIRGTLTSDAPATATPQSAPEREDNTPAAEVLDLVPPSAATGGAWTFPGTAAPPPSVETAPVPPRTRRDGIFAGLGETLGNLRAANPPGGFAGVAQARSPTVPIPDGASFETRSFANAAGSRAYKLYVPSGYTGQKLPLVVMLHGCTQSPDDFAAGTRMNELAEAKLCLVAYPAQAQSANAQRCWNWFRPADQQRDLGEPSLIAGITRDIMRDYAVDEARVYVAGLSAGGAAAAVMGQTYPDLFAAVGVHSGLACGVARDLPSALAAMRQGGVFAPAGMAGPAGVVPTQVVPTQIVPTIVFHGDRDTTVASVNGTLVIAQARGAAKLRTTVSDGKTPGGMDYVRTVEADATGRPMLEHFALHGAGHAWAGGSSAGSYTDPRGVDASAEMLRFFLRHERAAATD